MDIGIFSDIHGDLKALEIVLDRFDNSHKVDYILCAGDIIGRGSEPDQVAEIMRARAIPSVRGNHDEWIYGLTPENRDYLKNLPLDLRCIYESTAILICHGKPGSNLWGLYYDHVSKTLLNMMLGTLQADILITGHTHTPMYIRVARGCVINPGSIYTFTSMRTTSRTYGVLHLPELSFDLYDVLNGRSQPFPR